MLYLIYTATGDFYERFEFKAAMTNQAKMLEIAKNEKARLLALEDCKAYGDNLVLIREVKPDKIYDDYEYKEWFV